MTRPALTARSSRQPGVSVVIRSLRATRLHRGVHDDVGVERKDSLHAERRVRRLPSVTTFAPPAVVSISSAKLRGPATTTGTRPKTRSVRVLRKRGGGAPHRSPHARVARRRLAPRRLVSRPSPRPRIIASMAANDSVSGKYVAIPSAPNRSAISRPPAHARPSRGQGRKRHDGLEVRDRRTRRLPGRENVRREVAVARPSDERARALRWRRAPRWSTETGRPRGGRDRCARSSD
jgi:hypothetical protein